MKSLILFAFLLFTNIARGQLPCSGVKLYNQVIVKGDQPMLHKLKPFDVKLVPINTLLNMKREIIKATSQSFYSGLKLNSVKLFDSTGAIAWSWTHEPLSDKSANPVHLFYAVLFEAKAVNGTQFIFRVDVLKDGTLLNNKQLAFFTKGKLNIMSCEKISALVAKDTIQPIDAIEDLVLAYSLINKAIIWTVSSKVDFEGMQYYKEVNAATGAIVSRSLIDVNAPPEVELLQEVSPGE